MFANEKPPNLLSPQEMDGELGRGAKNHDETDVAKRSLHSSIKISKHITKNVVNK